MPSLEQKYKHITLRNKTSATRTVRYANGDSVTFNAGVKRRISTAGLAGLPDPGSFHYEHPKMEQLITDGVVTPNGYAAPVADSEGAPSDADNDDGDEADSSPAFGDTSESGQQPGPSETETSDDAETLAIKALYEQEGETGDDA